MIHLRSAVLCLTSLLLVAVFSSCHKLECYDANQQNIYQNKNGIYTDINCQKTLDINTLSNTLSAATPVSGCGGYTYQLRHRTTIDRSTNVVTACDTIFFARSQYTQPVRVAFLLFRDATRSQDSYLDNVSFAVDVTSLPQSGDYYYRTISNPAGYTLTTGNIWAHQVSGASLCQDSLARYIQIGTCEIDTGASHTAVTRARYTGCIDNAGGLHYLLLAPAPYDQVRVLSATVGAAPARLLSGGQITDAAQHFVANIKGTSNAAAAADTLYPSDDTQPWSRLIFIKN